MKKSNSSRIRSDCLRYMRKSVLMRFLSDLMSVVMPTLNAYLIGHMTDYLLALDSEKIVEALPLFLIAIGITVFMTPLFYLRLNLSLTKDGFSYDAYLMDCFIHKPLKSIETENFGSVIERMEDDSSAFCWNTVLLMSRPAMVFCYGCVMVLFMFQKNNHPLFILLIILLSSLPVWKARVFGKKKARFRREFSEYNELRRGLEAETVLSREFLYNYHLADFLSKLLHTQYCHYIEYSGEKKRRFESKSNVIDYLLRHGVPLAVFILGGIFVFYNRISIGSLLAGQLMLSAVQQCFNYGIELVEEIYNAPELISRLAVFYGDDEREGEPSHDRIGNLNAEEIVFSYEGKVVLNGLSVKIPGNGITQLLGENGSGKSTFCSILCGLYPPDSGRVFDDQGNTLTLNQLRGSVAIQEQDGMIFNGTVLENLFICDEKVTMAEKLLYEFGMEKPLDYAVETCGANLSPGEKRKIQLIRLFLQDVEFYILDEPLNHLDHQGINALIRRLKECKQGILLITHQSFLPDSFQVKLIRL